MKLSIYIEIDDFSASPLCASLPSDVLAHHGGAQLVVTRLMIASEGYVTVASNGSCATGKIASVADRVGSATTKRRATISSVSSKMTMSAATRASYVVVAPLLPFLSHGLL